MNRRLLILLAVIPVLAIVYVSIHGLPWRTASGDTDGGVAAPTGGRDDGDEGARPDSTAPPPKRPSEGGRYFKPSGSSGGGEFRQVYRLAQQRDPKNLPRLKKAAVESPDRNVKVAAISGIGKLGEKGDPELLMGILGNVKESQDARAAAADALGAMKCWPAGPALMRAMEDGSLLVRTGAAVAMRRIMQVDFGYDADAPTHERQRALARMREAWPTFSQRHMGATR